MISRLIYSAVCLVLFSAPVLAEQPNAQPNAQPDAQCTSFYSKLYQKSEIRVTIAFGYIDAPGGNASEGDVMYTKFVKDITRACSGGREDCGFTQDNSDAMLYTKTITVGGQPKQISMTLANIDTIDGPKDADDQQLQSQLAKNLFLGGIQTGSDIVFYLGHSREGGGPDFNPIQKTLPNGDFDYSSYEAQQVGIHEVYAAFDRAKTKPMVYGSFSCDSEHHWLTELKQHAPETFLILTSRVSYFPELFEGITNSLDALLRSECTSQMQSFGGTDLFFSDM